MGYAVNAAAEFEFFMFEETPQSIREKGYRQLKTMTPGAFGYSVLRSSVHSALYHEILDLGQAMRFPIEGLHTETGPGVLEAALEHCEALEAADRAALFKTFTKVLAQRHGLMATFMAKWSNAVPGQSGHLHLSMRTADGASVFHDPSKPQEISDAMRWFVGGQQALMPEFLAMIACTVNSYSRLVPGYWAPTSATWGIENRTTALRVIRGGPSSQRVEYRIAAADINPYVALAAAIGSGLWGIEHRIEPDAPIVGNAYDRDHPPHRRLPATLYEAAERLAASKPARTLFGDAVRRALRRDPAMGRTRVPQGDHRLGTGALFRNHLSTHMTDTLKTISPVDGRVYVERPLATAADIDRALDARAARASSPGGPRRWPARCACSAQAVDAFVAKGGRHRRRNHLADGPPDRATRPAKSAASRNARATCCRLAPEALAAIRARARRRASGARSSACRSASSRSSRPGIIRISPRSTPCCRP